MSIKNSRNFKFIVEDFAERIAHPEFFAFDKLGEIAKRSIEIIVKKYSLEDGDGLGVYLSHEPESMDNPDLIEAVNMEYRIWIGKEMRHRDCVKLDTNKLKGWYDLAKIEKILNEGCLEDGSLVVNCEVRIDCLIGNGGVRMFNFWEPFEKKNCLKITCDNWDSPMYVSKKLFLHHCKRFSNDRDAIRGHLYYNFPPEEDFEKFLQVLHGVNMNAILALYKDYEISRLYFVAAHCQAENVVRLVDYNSWPTDCPPYGFRMLCDYYDAMDLFMNWLLKSSEVSELKMLKDCIKWLDLRDVEGKALKGLAKKLFSFAKLIKVVIGDFAERIAHDNVFIHAEVAVVANRNIEIVINKTRIDNKFLGVYLVHNSRSGTVANDNIASANMKFRIWIGDGEEFSYTEECLDVETNKIKGWWKLAKVEKILEEGYLEDGALAIDGEVRIDGLRRKSGVGIFNFWDPFKGCLTINCPSWKKEKLYVNKKLLTEQLGFRWVSRVQKGLQASEAFRIHRHFQLFLHHCKRFSNDPRVIQGHLQLPFKYTSQSIVEVFLQFLHGVNLNIEPSWLTRQKVFILATWFKADNLFRHIDYDKLPNGSIDTFRLDCLDLDSYELLVRYVVKIAPNHEKFKTYLSWTQWERVEGEMLKGIAKKFFSFAVSPVTCQRINK